MKAVQTVVLSSKMDMGSQRRRAEIILQVLAVAIVGMSLLGAGCGSPTHLVPHPEPYPHVDSPAALVETLALAYHRLDFETFSSLLSGQGGPDFLFESRIPTPSGDESWGFGEEARIHRRMFQPKTPLQGETPVTRALWPESIDISLTRVTDFVEDARQYRTTANPTGLDPASWKAWQALYDTYVFFQLAGNTDYQVNGHAQFVIIEDLTNPGSRGKWLLYRWSDLDHVQLAKAGVAQAPAPSPCGVEQATWTAMKSLYR